jgi:hypothetical protein
MPKQQVSPSTLPAEERHARSRLHQILDQSGGFLHGSIIEMFRRCGRPNCRCASSDEFKHRAVYLGQTIKGKTTMVYIPVRAEKMVRQWVANFQQAGQLLEQISQQGRARLREIKHQPHAGNTVPAAPPPRKKAKPKPPQAPS